MSSTFPPPDSSFLNSALFRRACAHFATGVAIAAVRDASGVPHGLTINSFTSVSLEPPLVLICIDNRAVVLEVFRTASHFCINILADAQKELSNQFATRVDDRFVGVEWHPGVFGAPVVDGALAALECALVQTIEAGDHTILLAAAVSAEAATAGDVDPLLYFNSAYRRLAP